MGEDKAGGGLAWPGVLRRLTRIILFGRGNDDGDDQKPPQHTKHIVVSHLFIHCCCSFGSNTTIIYSSSTQPAGQTNKSRLLLLAGRAGDMIRILVN